MTNEDLVSFQMKCLATLLAVQAVMLVWFVLEGAGASGIARVMVMYLVIDLVEIVGMRWVRRQRARELESINQIAKRLGMEPFS